ncbi:ABC-2 transporter permease [Clostridium magnum]|uniref:ABC-2 family transporter protein n=1 Tax=Clostridium magnum DSM 2767 TaxID=1121326 RepID=A0A162RYC4_9CLOT|nr:ABC-2 transporter permease [Clostridium magnum]KZL90543.1 hypothetical protein CLMAG_43150 [Clostridium magnum DSM 2767]SHI04800.1 ABC-2 family transporter protein [Clostridium magnum DSM 2767]
MFSLVLKDILVQKKYVVFSVFYAIFFSFLFKYDTNSPMVFTMIPIMVSYMLVIGACGYDDKNKCEIMLNSLPINRSILVISKYLSTITFIFIGILLTFATTTILNISGFAKFNKLMSLEDILVPVVGVLLFACLYFPFYFKLGYQKSRYFITAVFFLIFAIPTTLSKIIPKGSTPPSFIVYLNSQPDLIIGMFITAVTFILLLISICFSIRFYHNRDL